MATTHNASLPDSVGEVAARRRPLQVRRLGSMGYAEALALQRALVADRQAGRIDDVLLLVEHPPVLTLGVRGDGGRGHILATDGALGARD
jgi:lipoyl(octanoyl) transferase